MPMNTALPLASLQVRVALRAMWAAAPCPLLGPNPGRATLQVLAAAGGSATPSRLQHVSAPAPEPSPGPRPPLHGCERTLLGALLAELNPKPDTPTAVAEALSQGRLSPAVAELDAEGARTFAVAASEVCS